jgi:molybdate transport system substrate-binding protein
MMPRRTLVAAFAGVALLGVTPLAAREKTLTVFAAASMKDALDAVNAAFMRASGLKVVTSYAATSALMKQIEQGAPADVFVSADTRWMDYGIEKKLVRENTRVDLLGNRLALIAPINSPLGQVTISRDLGLAKLIGDGRLVTADMKAVPAGRYAKAALESLGLWRSVEAKIAMVENVRAALALVARAEAPLGIVYATDPKVEPQVKTVGLFPEGSHPPIVYPVAATVAAKPAADRYLAFLRTQAAKAIFERYGFRFLVEPAS